jgi:hypothetical protein
MRRREIMKKISECVGDKWFFQDQPVAILVKRIEHPKELRVVYHCVKEKRRCAHISSGIGTLPLCSCGSRFEPVIEPTKITLGSRVAYCGREEMIPTASWMWRGTVKKIKQDGDHILVVVDWDAGVIQTLFARNLMLCKRS